MTGTLLPGGELRDTAALLHEVFPNAPRFADERYLDWYYRQCPLGRAFETDWGDAEGRLGHIGGILQDYHSKAGVQRLMFPLNVGVHPRARGQGIMSKLTAALWKQTEEKLGNVICIGMANEQSQPFYFGKMGYKLFCRLPTLVCPPVWPDLGRVESRRVDPAFLASPDFDAFASTLDFEPTEEWSVRYTTEFLRWRLGTPAVKLSLHTSDDVTAVTCVDQRKGIPFTMVLKTFRRKAAGARVVSANGVIAAACRFHRTPAAGYAGFSASVRVRGVQVPERFKPAPLYLCRSVIRQGTLDPESFRFDSFEFLDFDAY